MVKVNISLFFNCIYLLLEVEYWNPLLLVFDIFRCSNIGCAYIYDCYVFLMSWAFCEYIMTSFISCYIFGLKSIFSDISRATPVLFWFPLTWIIFFHPFTLSLCVFLKLKWVSCRQHIVGSCFFFYPSSRPAFWLENSSVYI